MNIFIALYQRNPVFDTGYRLLTIDETHVPVRILKAKDIEDAYLNMQGEVWSPNGEARTLIKELGLKHTSMMVGDIFIDLSDNKKVYSRYIWI